MAKVYFRYSAMNAGKSTQLLQVRHNYHERGQKTILLKPSVDDRDGPEFIKPRIGGIEAKVDAIVEPEDDVRLVVANLRFDKVDCVLVDEAQFFTKQQILQLCSIADLGTPVMCYGLRSDFRGELFPGSAALMALADDIEELKTICWCGRKATMNARIMNGKVVRDGPQIMIGGNESYVTLCRKHWSDGVFEPD